LNGKEWFEDQDFWLAYAPLMFDESRWAEVPEAVDRLVKLSSIKAGGRVLDLCCGVGRHSVEFARRGFSVTGVDITEAYLEAAAETAAAEAAGASLELVRDDARHFSRPGQFDLCLNLYTSFGYFSRREDDLLLLRNCAKNLAPGGRLILETVGKETAARDFVEREEFERAGWNVTTEFKILGGWEYEVNRWILEKGSERIDHSFALRLYSGYEMKQALAEAGFASASIFGGLDGKPYDEKADSLVAVASR
jgi:SAM-dependent methyltransferase